MNQIIVGDKRPGAHHHNRHRRSQFKDFCITYHPFFQNRIIGEIRYVSESSLQESTLSQVKPVLQFALWYCNRWMMELFAIDIKTTPELGVIPDLIRHIYSEIADWSSP